MTSFVTQKALTGFAALAVATTGSALSGFDAKAAPLIFDCYSRSTSDLLMKSALDLSNENLACVQNGVGAQVSYVPTAPQQVYVTPAPSPSPSGGESFFGSMLGGAIGGVIGNAINGGNRTTEIHHHHNGGNQKAGEENEKRNPQPGNQPYPGNFKLVDLNKAGVDLVKFKQQQQQIFDGAMRAVEIQKRTKSKERVQQKLAEIRCGSWFGSCKK
jgi:hypothetical protein